MKTDFLSSLERSFKTIIRLSLQNTLYSICYTIIYMYHVHVNIFHTSLFIIITIWCQMTFNRTKILIVNCVWYTWGLPRGLSDKQHCVKMWQQLAKTTIHFSFRQSNNCTWLFLSSIVCVYGRSVVKILTKTNHQSALFTKS